MYGEIAPNLIEDLSKAQPFGIQPARKGPFAEAEPVGDCFGPCLGVRQKRCDDVHNLCSKRADAGCAVRNGVLAVLRHQVVEIWVIPNYRQVHHAGVETDRVFISVEADVAAQNALDFSTVRTMVHEARR